MLSPKLAPNASRWQPKRPPDQGLHLHEVHTKGSPPPTPGRVLGGGARGGRCTHGRCRSGRGRRPSSSSPTASPPAVRRPPDPRSPDFPTPRPILRAPPQPPRDNSKSTFQAFGTGRPWIGLTGSRGKTCGFRIRDFPPKVEGNPPPLALSPPFFFSLFPNNISPPFFRGISAIHFPHQLVHPFPSPLFSPTVSSKPHGCWIRYHRFPE